MNKLYKKYLGMLIIAMLVSLSIIAINPSTAYASGAVTVEIDGIQVTFDDQNPTIIDGRTLVPVRGVFEALGFDVGWNGDTQQVTLTSSNYTVILTIGSSTFSTNGQSHVLDVPAQIINGRTMLPIRAVLESVGLDVDWDGGRSAVLIATGSTEVATDPELITAPDDALAHEFHGVRFYTREHWVVQVRDSYIVIPFLHGNPIDIDSDSIGVYLRDAEISMLRPLRLPADEDPRAIFLRIVNEQLGLQLTDEDIILEYGPSDGLRHDIIGVTYALTQGNVQGFGIAFLISDGQDHVVVMSRASHTYDVAGFAELVMSFVILIEVN